MECHPIMHNLCSSWRHTLHFLLNIAFHPVITPQDSDISSHFSWLSCQYSSLMRGTKTNLTRFLRIYLEYHYVNQIFIGALVGITMGCIWFFVVHVILTPWFPWIVSRWGSILIPHISFSKLGRLLMLQDFTHVPNIFRVEYNAMLTYGRKQR